jgi:steroid 5-alpha reductase family enzyme
MPRNSLVALGILASIAVPTRTARSAVLALAVQAAVFGLHALPHNSEKYYDASGSLTHLVLTVDSLLRSGAKTPRQTLNSVFSVIWATRLGSYLYARMLRDGADHRFDAMKQAGAVRFAQAWAIQALWCFIVQLPLVISNQNDDQREDLNFADFAGMAVFVAGFLLEVVADSQKAAHRARAENANQFIRQGLWSWSRHPNMLGRSSFGRGSR